MEFLRSDYRVRHIRKMHPEVTFACSTCNLTFNTHNELGTHMLEQGHSDLSRDNVSSPVMQVSRKMEIETPEEGTAELGQYQCTVDESCSKRFLNLHNLKLHENLHTGKKSITQTSSTKRFFS